MYVRKWTSEYQYRVNTISFTGSDVLQGWGVHHIRSYRCTSWNKLQFILQSTKFFCESAHSFIIRHVGWSVVVCALQRNKYILRKPANLDVCWLAIIRFRFAMRKLYSSYLPSLKYPVRKTNCRLGQQKYGWLWLSIIILLCQFFI